jgi:hypothetical protein
MPPRGTDVKEHQGKTTKVLIFRYIAEIVPSDTPAFAGTSKLPYEDNAIGLCWNPDPGHMRQRGSDVYGPHGYV